MDKFYYAVYHCWEKDYYNTQVWVNDLICVFDSLEKAEEFQKKYEKPTDSYGWYKRGRIAIINTRTPMPPIQCVKLRQKSKDFGRASTSERIEAPVVVKPDTVSKRASMKFGI